MEDVKTELQPIKFQLAIITLLIMVDVFARATFIDIDQYIWLRPTLWIIMSIVLCYATVRAGGFAIEWFFTPEDKWENFFKRWKR